ncbi:hypothetical protein [Campylobacter pinnipediorum]|nr:hypothetical protein [Campylobacter pinnipediorum]
MQELVCKMAYDTKNQAPISIQVLNRKTGSDKFELNKLKMIALNANTKHSLTAFQDSIRLSLSKNDDVS